MFVCIGVTAVKPEAKYIVFASQIEKIWLIYVIVMAEKMIELNARDRQREILLLQRRIRSAFASFSSEVLPPSYLT